MADALVSETQKLYGLPLAEFTAARNARAKELREDDPELAAAIAALPKPTVSAAALNELVREDPSEVSAAIQSGTRLRQAQEAAVAGKKGADLNAATSGSEREVTVHTPTVRHWRLGNVPRAASCTPRG